jgi:hypothetical protein
MITRFQGRLAFLRLAPLTALCFGLPFTATATDTWIEVQSPHFQVVSNAGENESRKVADQFE